jgi:hypothetical protein
VLPPNLKGFGNLPALIQRQIVAVLSGTTPEITAPSPVLTVARFDIRQKRFTMRPPIKVLNPRMKPNASMSRVLSCLEFYCDRQIKKVD